MILVALLIQKAIQLVIINKKKRAERVRQNKTKYKFFIYISNVVKLEQGRLLRYCFFRYTYYQLISKNN